MSSANLNNTFLLSINSAKHSERQHYIFDLIFHEVLGIEYVLVPKEEQADLAYGTVNGTIVYNTHSFIHEEALKEVKLESVVWDQKNFPFKIDPFNSDLPFDPFAVCFYFISRYEEYFSVEKDQHQRFPASNSWLFKNDWLKTPIVNYVVSIIKKQLEEKLGIKIKPKRKYTVLPTFDIDNPFAFYQKEGSMIKSILKSFSKLNLNDALLKKKAYKNAKIDPFFTHDEIIKSLELYSLKAVIFFLMKHGRMNANGGLNSKEFNQIISSYSKYHHKIGIHPSYNSFQSKENIEKEKNILEQKHGESITSNRFHYIQLSLPESYHFLLSNGIKEDYTMGYPETSGFRAGVCQSFLWFDLTKNKVTDLKVYPFYFMDATFIFNSNFTKEEALIEISNLTNEVKKYNGQNIFIFHNESISGYDLYKEWQSLFIKSLSIVK